MRHFIQNPIALLTAADDFIWGPFMLCFLVGTGIFLTIRTKALCWRNLPYALKSVLSREARAKTGDGDVSPFSALMTALAATIGTGNIVGVATAMISGGPGALVWMWISAAFGITSKFSECLLAIRFREVNANGEMSGGPMYTMKNGFRHKRFGAILGWCFALFAVIASFGIGNLTQANSISTALTAAYHIPAPITGAVITALALFIIIGGIKSISKVSQFIVPVMAIFYIVTGLIVIGGNIARLPSGIAMIFQMAFSTEAVGGGLCGSMTASMAQAIRFGVARGVFSNEAGMGSAAISAAAATAKDPVQQGYISMTGTFWDTIVVCSITGLCIACSGALGSTHPVASGSYYLQNDRLVITSKNADGQTMVAAYAASLEDSALTLRQDGTGTTQILRRAEASSVSHNAQSDNAAPPCEIAGLWTDTSGNEYFFGKNADYEYKEILEGAALTIAAFETVLGKPGSSLITISIALFAFSTILGWEYHGEKAFEYIMGTQRLNMLYRILFSLLAYVGATTTLEIAWTFSDIANAFMAIPNLICLLAMSGIIKTELERYQSVLKKEKNTKRKIRAKH